VIDYRDDRHVDLAAFAMLRASCEFAAKDPDFLQCLIDGARWVVHAHSGERMVGFARAISDGVATGYISTVMVDPAYRRRGIARAMLERLMAGRDEIKFVLHTRSDAAALYAAVGFVPATDMLVRPRR
jgi:ribosomal protein S18 acetylase RimI-like enzyme